MDPSLLRRVRTEVQEHLSFAPKETDIYKIHQSGDLANLDGLDDESLTLLPSLKTLRDALYSPDFRSYLCHVTGSSFVSGKKTDMAINIYTPGSHLLCHDDVIGSRRISYILYLTDPDVPWQSEWGGALRLYPTEKLHDSAKNIALVPHSEPSKSIPPAFNQLSFFAVQPGASFHDVEEVYAPGDGQIGETPSSRVRMAISGWYHIPQEGEEGYASGEETSHAEQSSLTQLQGMPHVHDRPQSMRTDYPLSLDGGETSSSADPVLTETDLDFLLKYLAPTYLTPDTLDSVSESFCENSSIVLENFLSKKFCDDIRLFIGSSEQNHDMQDWEVARPPHKHRYLYQRASKTASNPLQMILNDLIPSHAFQKWLQLATEQQATSHDTILRRFRRGKDYTLAHSYDASEPQIELCLGLTPSSGWEKVENDTAHGERSDLKREADSEDGFRDVGGYLAYMNGENVDEPDDGKSDDGVLAPSNKNTNGRAAKPPKPKADPAIYQAQDDDEDDGVLFTMPACWNRLGIVMRDKGTMRFVKYVSRSAGGDRWDVFGEFEIMDQASVDGSDGASGESNSSDENGEDGVDLPTDTDTASDA